MFAVSFRIWMLKSVEPIALRAGTPVRTLQEFLAQHRWDEDALRRRLIHIVRDEHITANTVGIIDETSDVKKGDKTPGVQRQWCGKVGKRENCIVTVHLAAATEDFHCMVDVGMEKHDSCWMIPPREGESVRPS